MRMKFLHSTKQKGFTLIESLLVFGVFALILIGVYSLAVNVTATANASNEADKLNTVIEKIERVVGVNGTFEDVTIDVFNQLTENYASSLNFTGIEAQLDTLTINYADVPAASCTKFSEKMLIKNRNVSVNINDSNLPAYTDIALIVSQCDRPNNTIRVVLNNNNLVTSDDISTVVPTAPHIRETGVPYSVAPFAKSSTSIQPLTGEAYSVINRTTSGYGP